MVLLENDGAEQHEDAQLDGDEEPEVVVNAHAAHSVSDLGAVELARGGRARRGIGRNELPTRIIRWEGQRR